MTFSIKPRFHQCDPAGILYFASIFDLTHDVYEDWLSQIGFEYKTWFENPEWAVPIINCNADFKAPIKAGNTYQAKPSITKVGNSSFQVKWSFTKDDNLHCETTMTHVFIDKVTGKKREIPQNVKEALNGN